MRKKAKNKSTEDSKLWWKSKTIHANILLVIASILNKKFGVEIDAELQLAILAVINMILRSITDKKITLTDQSSGASQNDSEDGVAGV